MWSLSLISPPALEPLDLEAEVYPHLRLEPELTPQEAADCLWVITSFDTFDQLYTDRALDRSAVADRLITLARSLVLPR